MTTARDVIQNHSGFASMVPISILHHSKAQRRCRGIRLQGTILHINISPVPLESGDLLLIYIAVISMPHFSQFYSDIFLNQNARQMVYRDQDTPCVRSDALKQWFLLYFNLFLALVVVPLGKVGKANCILCILAHLFIVHKFSVCLFILFCFVFKHSH